MERPDLTAADPLVVAYIEYLEQENARLAAKQPKKRERSAGAGLEPTEPETTVNVVVISRSGLAKRTPRHLYGRQKRGGMGNFDIDLKEDDEPFRIVVADEAADLLVITNFARVFRVPVAQVTATEPRGRGNPLYDLLDLHAKETIADVLGGDGEAVALLTPRGYVFVRRRHYLRDGNFLYDTANQGGPVAACWTAESEDLFISTTGGKAIRFWSKQVPKGGCLGLRLDPGDELLNLTSVPQDGGVFLLGHDGKGTIRLMSGFRQNKAPGAGGKVAFKTERLVTAMGVGENDDLFVISQLNKMIRFNAGDIPAKEGVVQGVNCMALRSDETAAAGVAQLSP